MDQLIKKIEELESASKPLDMDLKTRTTLLNQVIGISDKFLESLPDAKAYIEGSPNPDELMVDGKPAELGTILTKVQKSVFDLGLNAASGGHLGYIPGGGIFASALGDYLADVSNAYAGVSYASPGAVAIENSVLNWLKDVFDFPRTAVGNLASGGSVSNLIALTAARDKYKIKNEKITGSVVYLSEQVHHCIHKALRIIGLEDVVIRHLPLDHHFKIIPAALNQLIEKDLADGLNPFLVIASAGTTDTGTIDPLEEIDAIARKHHLWFHVDAAYGGFFILTHKKKLFRGIEKADSLVVDPHKGLFLPYGIGAVLVKDRNAVFASQHYSANYMQDTVLDDWAIDPANVSPELTKHFRGLRVWLPLKLYGIEPFKACLEEKLLLTEYFRNRLTEIGFQVGPEPDLSVSYFWYPAPKELVNTFNEKLMEEIHHDGSVFLSSTLINGQFVIRIAILSFRTKKETIDRAMDMIDRCLAKVKREIPFSALKN